MDSPHKSASQIVGIVATLDLLRADEFVNVLHGDDGGFAVEIEEQELLALLVGELLSLLDGILLSDVEEPIFEENDNFSIVLFVIWKFMFTLCSVRGAFNPARDTSLIPARAYSGFFIASILSFPMQYISLNCLYCDVPFRPENFSYPSSNISWLKLSFEKNKRNS